jgi:glutamate-1-semialdehyde 2,1-aminomutase
MSGSMERGVAAWTEAVEAAYRAQNPGSSALFERAGRVMPGGDTRFSLTLAPFSTYFREAAGSWLTDVDGNRYLDLVNQATAMIHGHAHPAVVAAASDQVARGTGWSGPNPHQVRLAELIAERVPSMAQVRFTNSGTEAVAMMVKVARAFTGRDLVLKLGATYHGSADFLEFGPDPADPTHAVPTMEGVPRNLDRNLVIGRFNDTDGVVSLIEQHGDALAAVVLTPMLSVGFVEPAPGFLEALREATARHGALLLFDEVICFRVAPGGAQQRYGVTPDMTALGKIIGGGFPVGAFGGSPELMALTDPNGTMRVAHAGTYNGNPVTSAAGVAAMELLTPAAYDRLEAVGEALRAGLRSIVAETGAPFRVSGVASLAGLDFDAGGDPELAAVGPRILRTLRIAYLVHGTHALGIAGTTVITDAEVADALSRIRDTITELMAHLPAPVGSRA